MRMACVCQLPRGGGSLSFCPWSKQRNERLCPSLTHLVNVMGGCVLAQRPLASVGILREFPVNGTFLPHLESKRTEQTSKKVIETDTAFISGSSRIGGFALRCICQRGFQEDHGYPTCRSTVSPERGTGCWGHSSPGADQERRVHCPLLLPRRAPREGGGVWVSVPRRAGTDRQTLPHRQPRLRSNSWENLGGISPPRDRHPDAVPVPPVRCLLGSRCPISLASLSPCQGLLLPFSSSSPGSTFPKFPLSAPPSLEDLCSHSRALRLQCGFEEETRSVRVGSSLSRWNPDDWFHGVGERGSEGPACGSSLPTTVGKGPSTRALGPAHLALTRVQTGPQFCTRARSRLSCSARHDRQNLPRRHV
ncbi:uncharacterized protein LOC116596257 isoform X2 [Mustela erminea]|uniref:uncharacterized protein LOC116596257 isoform X2 n=1 Tax=Mustela erminea TaxID=36723 RepID=UPI00138694C4|nr:uncharacterized protein LOC116596257 isoform X2 [Mustela erminea]